MPGERLHKLSPVEQLKVENIFGNLVWHQLAAEDKIAEEKMADGMVSFAVSFEGMQEFLARRDAYIAASRN